ncbi:MAG: ABC transporter ATP-binding protein [Thermaerobacter sp.]|nr:ABC transporter ATP-binding protein [Thermaerobacter sp.]
MAKETLRFENVAKRIGSGTILDRISFTLHQGRALALVGSNGAGKSTVLKVAAGVWGRTGGRLERFGTMVSLAANSDARIGYLGERSFLYENLSLIENLRLYCRLWGLDPRDTQLDEVVWQVGLSWCQHDRIQSYSRGMRQRAALARVWLVRPKLWVLDEPESGLDDTGRRWLVNLLCEEKQSGASFLIATHRPDLMESGLDLVASLESGRLAHWWSVASTQDIHQVKF